MKHNISSLQKAERPAKITWANIKAIIQAFFRKKRRMIAGFELSAHIYEQIIWRRTRVQYSSPICWYSGNCRICGCEILGKTMEDRGCALSEHPDLSEKREPCYPPMMKKDEWELYKEKNNIKLFK